MSDLEVAFQMALKAVGVNKNFLSTEQQLELYGLYKIITVGKCTTQKPSILDPKERAKWNSWDKAGGLSRENAMMCYVSLVHNWTLGKARPPENESVASSAMGHQVSFITKEDPHAVSESYSLKVLEKLETKINNFVEDLVESIPYTDVNLQDEQGFNVLHWACDQGKPTVVEILFVTYGNQLDVCAQDIDGNTPLHLAVICNHSGIAKTLLRYISARNGVRETVLNIRNKDGETVGDIASPSLRKELQLTPPM